MKKKYKILISLTIPLALMLSGFATGFMATEQELLLRVFMFVVAVGAWLYIAVVSWLMDALEKSEKKLEMTIRQLAREMTTKVMRKWRNNN